MRMRSRTVAIWALIGFLGLLVVDAALRAGLRGAPDSQIDHSVGR